MPGLDPGRPDPDRWRAHFTQTSRNSFFTSNRLRCRCRCLAPCTVALCLGATQMQPTPSPAGGLARWLWIRRQPRRHLLHRPGRRGRPCPGRRPAAPENREPLLLRQERRPVGGSVAAEVHQGRRADFRRDRRRHRHPALQERRPARHRGQVRVPGLDPGRGVRHERAAGRPPHHRQIREKQQARIEYDSAKKEGKTAALLEQHLPNVFQMNVANIMPGDDVKVELRYTELLVPQAGNYQFVFPTVVGPRYNSPQSSQATAQVGEQAVPARRPSPAARTSTSRWRSPARSA